MIDYKQEYGYTLKPGSVLAFKDSGLLHLGLIVAIEKTEAGRQCTLIEPSGRKRIRMLDHDLENGTMLPLLQDLLRDLHCAAWDEWKAKHL